MDYRYRKRPIVIEAFQMTAERRWDNADWPEWLNRAWNGELGDVGSMWPYTCSEDPILCVGTLEGRMLVLADDYIIRGVKGELYPCKPNIFEATYEKVEETNTPSRPQWCLEQARVFLAPFEERLANLLDDAYLRGRREERKR